MKDKLYILLLVLVACLIQTSCSDNDDPAQPEKTTTDDIPPQPEPDYSTVKCDDPVFLSSRIQPEVKTSIETFLTNIAPLEEAEVAVVHPEDIGTYEGKLYDLYNRGGLVVVVNPTTEGFADFAVKYGIPNYMPTESTQPLLLFATDNKHHHYALYANGPFDGNYADDIEEYVPEEPINEVIKEPQIESEDIYYKRRIFEFFRWIRQELKHTKTRGETQWVATYNPYLTYVANEHIFHNFDIPMNHDVYKMAGCSKDYLNVDGSIDVKYDIYNAYVFGGVSNPGDYYIVTRSVTVHNGDSYKPYNRWHGGIKMWVTGYYMKGLELLSKLKDMNGKDLSGSQFALDPTPNTTVNATSYTSGYSFNINGALSAGTSNGLSLGFGATYSNSNTKTISDLEIVKLTDSSNRQVTYKYTIKNILDNTIVLYTWDGNDKLTNDVPLIARSDFDAVSDWCWLIPAGTNGVGDNETTKFKIYTHFEFDYGCQVRVVGTWGTAFDENHSYTHTGAWYQPITVPDRHPFGIMALQNGHDHKIGKINIWKQGEQGDPNKVFYQLGHSIKANESEDIALPTGKYYVEYCQLDGDNGILSTWKLEDVTIHGGNTRDDAAQIASTENAQLISK